MRDCDVVFVGAGHNALVCAGYLARAGYRVILAERRPIVGGAVVTEEHIPGFRFDLGGSAHILIHHTPIVRDLELERYGLEYIDVDPMFFAPYPDGSSITIWKDLDRTCESIARISPQDADNYRRFVAEWRTIAGALVETFLHPPTPMNILRHLVIGSRLGRQKYERIRELTSSYGDVIRRLFVSPKLQGLIGWMAAQSGPPPGEPFSAPFALWHPMYHVSGVKRPRGGSGMLTQALARMVEAHGGRILLDAPVRKILVEGRRAVGIETTDGTRVTARAVASGAHIRTTVSLLGEENVPPRARALLDRVRIGNGFGMMVRYAMRELPDYLAVPNEPGRSHMPHHQSLQFICPDLDYLGRAYGDYLARQPSREPGLIAMTFSTIDPTLAPAGQHVLFLWGQYYPYELADRQQWNDIGQREADRMLATLAKYAPNVAGAVIGSLVETPTYLEETLGLLRGNVMHLEMSVDQMFLMRPALTMSNYRGPLRGLYLTGASTHPGGGIMGAAGRNAATVLLRDLGRRWYGGRRL